MLPGIGQIPYNIRLGMIVLYFIAAGILTYSFEGDRVNRVLLLASVLLVPIIAIFWSLVQFGILVQLSNSAIFNLPVMLLLIMGILIARKTTVLKIFLIHSLGFYLLEYPQGIGLW